MHICILTPTFLPTIGGVETSVDHMCRTLQSMGHRVCVVTERAKGFRGRLDLPYPVYRYSRPWSSRWGLRPIRRLLERLHRSDPFDVVHAMVTQPTGYVAWRFHRRSGVAVVVTPRGDDIWPASRYRRRPAIWRRIQQTLREAPMVTGIGRYMADLIRELTGGREATVIHNGISPALFARRPRQPAAERLARFTRVPYILGLGRLVPQKGFDVLIRAFAQVAAKWPRHELVIAGRGREQETLARLIDELALGERIHLVGEVIGDDKLFLLQNCQLTAMPSHYEGYSNVVLESMFCGRPVVGTRIASLLEVIEEGVNGALAEPNCPTSLAETLDRTLPGGVLSRLSEGTAKTAAEHAWPVICEQYLALYRRGAECYE